MYKIKHLFQKRSLNNGVAVKMFREGSTLSCGPSNTTVKHTNGYLQSENNDLKFLLERINNLREVRRLQR